MEFIDEKFGKAFICLDTISKQIENQNTKRKIDILKIIVENLNRQLIDLNITYKNNNLTYNEWARG